MQCYYPNGQSADGLRPCNATAAVSHCCRSSDVCITNGFCFSSGLNAVVRRGCTDKTFNSTKCPQQCTIGDNLRSADVVMTPCDSYTSFCCGQDQAARNCCSTGNGTVRIPAGSPMLSMEGDNNKSISTVTISTTISPTGSSTTCPSANSTVAASCSKPQKGATIGLGAALGFVALAAVILALLWGSAKRRIRELEEPLER